MALPLVAAGVGIYKFLTGVGLLTVLKYFTVAVIAKLIFVFGVSFVIYEGMDIFIQTVTTNINNYVNLPTGAGFAEALQILKIMRLPDAVNLIISTYTAVASLALVNGTVKRLSLG